MDYSVLLDIPVWKFALIIVCAFTARKLFVLVNDLRRWR